jgi:hypothetical protein
MTAPQFAFMLLGVDATAVVFVWAIIAAVQLALHPSFGFRRSGSKLFARRPYTCGTGSRIRPGSEAADTLPDLYVPMYWPPASFDHEGPDLPPLATSPR